MDPEQLCEIWPRSTGRTSENGERLPQEDWGYDMRDGVLTRVEGEERVEETLLTVPGNYPAYYAAIRDALNGDGENPVPASQAIRNGVD